MKAFELLEAIKLVSPDTDVLVLLEPLGDVPVRISKVEVRESELVIIGDVSGL